MNSSLSPSEPPPPGIISNFTNPVTLASAIISISVTSSALAFVLLSMRLHSTTNVTRSMGADDYTAITAFILSLAFEGLVIHQRDYARHTWDLPISSLETISNTRMMFAESTTKALSLLFSKVSILILFFRIFSVSQRLRYAIYFGIFTTALACALSIVVTAANCPSDSCSTPFKWAVAKGTLNVFLDFYILGLPIPTLWKLNMGMRKKVGVIGIFITGLIACGASVLALSYKIKYVTGEVGDPLWDSFKLSIFNIIEVNAAIMTACMPACPAFFRYLSSKFNFSKPIISWLSYTKFSRGNKGQLTEKDCEHPTSTKIIPAIGSNESYWHLEDTLPTGDISPQTTLAKDRKSVFLPCRVDSVNSAEDFLSLDHRLQAHLPHGRV